MVVSASSQLALSYSAWHLSVNEAGEPAGEFNPLSPDTLPLETASVPPPTPPDALSDDEAAEVIAGNFGLIDIARLAALADGRASRDDLQSAADSGVMRREDAERIHRVLEDPALFARLDARDGFEDGELTLSALAVAGADQIQREVQDAFEARYDRNFVELVDQTLQRRESTLGEVDFAGLSAAGFRALDALDGTLDGQVTVAALGDQFKPQAQLLQSPANDGSGRSVLQAAMQAMAEQYAALASAGGTLSAEDAARVNFGAALTARQALQNGMPLAGEGGFTADLDAAFFAAHLVDQDAVMAHFDASLNTPAVQADLAAKVREFTSDVASRVRAAEVRISSPLYAHYLRVLETSGRGQEARSRSSEDLSALRLLDPAAADRAASRLLENLAAVVIDEGRFDNTPAQTAQLAVQDVLETMSMLKAARVGLRTTGQIATLMTHLDDVLADMAAGKTALATLSKNLSSLFGYTQSAGGDIRDASRLLADADMPSMKAATPEAERVKMKNFITELDRLGVWQTGAALFGVTNGIYRLAHPGEQPWDRLYAAQEFLASASYITGPAKALGQFLEARAGSSPSKFNSALKMPLAELVRKASMSEGLSGLAESTLSAASRSSAAVADSPAIELDRKHRLSASVVKGFAAATEVGSGVIGVVLGAKVIADGVAHGDDTQTALGSITLTSGVATMVGAALNVAFSIGTPVLIFAGVLSIAAIMASLFTQKTCDQVLGDEIEKRWDASGWLKDNWRDALKQWCSDHFNNGDTGMGMDM